MTLLHGKIGVYKREVKMVMEKVGTGVLGAGVGVVLGGIGGYVGGLLSIGYAAGKMAAILAENVEQSYRCKLCVYETTDLASILQHLQAHGVLSSTYQGVIDVFQNQ